MKDKRFTVFCNKFMAFPFREDGKEEVMVFALNYWHFDCYIYDNKHNY